MVSLVTAAIRARAEERVTLELGPRSGRTHHLTFSDLEMTADAKTGAIVELRNWDDAKGQRRLSLTTASDLTIGEQVHARGVTWLDRQFLSRDQGSAGDLILLIAFATISKICPSAPQDVSSGSGSRLAARD